MDGLPSVPCNWHYSDDSPRAGFSGRGLSRRGRGPVRTRLLLTFLQAGAAGQSVAALGCQTHDPWGARQPLLCAGGRPTARLLTGRHPKPAHRLAALPRIVVAAPVLLFVAWLGQASGLACPPRPFSFSARSIAYQRATQLAARQTSSLGRTPGTLFLSGAATLPACPAVCPQSAALAAPRRPRARCLFCLLHPAAARGGAALSGLGRWPFQRTKG